MPTLEPALERRCGVETDELVVGAAARGLARRSSLNAVARQT
jgi:hypothetical protein